MWRGPGKLKGLFTASHGVVWVGLTEKVRSLEEGEGVNHLAMQGLCVPEEEQPGQRAHVGSCLEYLRPAGFGQWYWNVGKEVREGQIMQDMVRTLTLQSFEQRSDVIKLCFKRITLAVVGKINKRNGMIPARVSSDTQMTPPLWLKAKRN